MTKGATTVYSIRCFTPDSDAGLSVWRALLCGYEGVELSVLLLCAGICLSDLQAVHEGDAQRHLRCVFRGHSVSLHYAHVPHGENLYFQCFFWPSISLCASTRELLGDLALGGDPWSYVYDPPYHPGGDSGVALVWLMKQKELGKKWGIIFGRGFLIVAALGIAYSPWVYNGIKRRIQSENDRGLFHCLQDESGAADPGAAGAVRGVLRRIFCTNHSPCAGPLQSGPSGLWTWALKDLQRLQSALGDRLRSGGSLLCGCDTPFLAGLLQLSGVCQAERRYIIYFTVLFVILAAVVLFQKKPKFKHKWLNVVLTYILPAALIIVSILWR